MSNIVKFFRLVLFVYLTIPLCYYGHSQNEWSSMYGNYFFSSKFSDTIVGKQNIYGKLKREDIQGQRPNIILIMADDLGYGDLDAFGGNGSINTPNLDGLADNGLKLTNYHTNGVNCSPTRAALMTGLYPQEVGIEGVITAKSHRHTGMDPKVTTLAELVGKAGYRSGIIGKWHLGYQPKFGPIAQGFDEFRGFVSGNVDYKSHIDQEGYTDWWKGTKLIEEEGYITEIITDHGIQFMKSIQDNTPFFLYLAHGAPHFPYQGPNDPAYRTVNGDFPTLGPREDIEGAYIEMVESLDRNIGRILDYLEENQLLENTLIIFSSDNGPMGTVGSNAPFRGYKGQVYEGGHHVPALFHWKGVIDPRVSDDLVLSMDIFPTIADMLNIKNFENSKKVSGLSITPILCEDTNFKPLNNRTVFWRFRNGQAALKGKWKLVVVDGKSSLYNLSEDIKESKDIKAENQDIFLELKRDLQNWEESLRVELRSH
ncbi:sulfatase-like hydrolase/transferase [Membranihabitans maritimus]|uniref:sulfatase-like hydrolase/transferase n=1 Tax=Membranihabitans maritimus TaxID=2904244 RepID=UPI001F00BFD6|nr:sulfatase-like hydrolase/transferase [Membranihabitans maritimus]